MDTWLRFVVAFGGFIAYFVIGLFVSRRWWRAQGEHRYDADSVILAGGAVFVWPIVAIQEPVERLIRRFYEGGQ